MDELTEYTCCFTGHRPQNLPFGSDEFSPACIDLKKTIKEKIIYLIEEKRVRRFITGMALGVDMWAAEIVLELKRDYPFLLLEAAVPCRNQSNRWRAADRRRYDEILMACDNVNVLQESYTQFCMQMRNEYMVDNSSYVIAVWNGKASGTGNTVRYAKRMKKEVIVVDAADDGE